MAGDVRRVSQQDIQLVQNLIERCLQLYMSQKEVVQTLLVQGEIEPDFTELVWQKLEEENREFFKAYHVRLILKNQIVMFNKLLAKQVELMHKVCPSGASSLDPCNGTNTSMLHQTPCYITDHASIARPDNVLGSGGPVILMNGSGSSGQHNLQMGNGGHIHGGRPNGSTNMISSQTTNMGGILQGLDAPIIKSEPSYSDNSEFTFCSETSFLDVRSTMGDAPASSFGSVELGGQSLNDALLDVNNTYGLLSQMPRAFSFSDLTEDFTQCNDIMESYGRSPFLEPDGSQFAGSPGERRLHTLPDGHL